MKGKGSWGKEVNYLVKDGKIMCVPSTLAHLLRQREEVISNVNTFTKVAEQGR